MSNKKWQLHHICLAEASRTYKQTRSLKMDSFVSLFDPACSDEHSTENLDLSVNWEPNGNIYNVNNATAIKHLPPEPQVGNIEYKLKLINPSRQRFEHLVTQMKWRLREGQGEAIYEIGVEDSGRMRGICREEMKASLDTLNQMAIKLGATISVLRETVVSDSITDSKTVAEVLVRKVPSDRPSIDLRVAVMGYADAGKSSLLGVLTQGEYDDGRGRARLNMFRHLHEVQSGRTSSITHEILGFDSQGRAINYQEGSPETICELSTKLVTLIDLAGHQKYMRTTLRGIQGYSPHYIMFLISSASGFTKTAQEHLTFALAMQIPMVIVVSKIDLTTWSKLEGMLLEIEEFLSMNNCKRAGIRLNCEDDVISTVAAQPNDLDIPILCLSSVTGEGLPLLNKLLHLLPPGLNAKERERLEQESPEFQIDETFRIPQVGTILGGLLTQGIVKEGTGLLLGPMDDGTFQPVTVTSIRRHKIPCCSVKASQSASIGLNVQVAGLREGMVLVAPQISPKSYLFFQAEVHLLYHATRIASGFQTTVHIGNVRQTAVMEKILPACLSTNDHAMVIFRFIKHPEYIKVGARLLFREGSTKGFGTVTRVYTKNPGKLC